MGLFFTLVLQVITLVSPSRSVSIVLNPTRRRELQHAVWTPRSLGALGSGFVPSFHLECWWNQSLMSHLSPSAGALKHTRYGLVFSSLPTCVCKRSFSIYKMSTFFSFSFSLEESGYSFRARKFTRVFIALSFPAHKPQRERKSSSAPRYVFLSVALFRWLMSFLTNPAHLLVKVFSFFSFLNLITTASQYAA